MARAYTLNPRGRRKRRPINMLDPAIQAEIARRVDRQVALALKQEREQRYYASAVKEQSFGPRLVRFLGGVATRE